MIKYEIRDVVCDYGLYEDGELKLILNSRANAEYIKAILEVDCSEPNVAIAYEPEVENMTDEQVLALYRYCTYGFENNPCSLCPLRSSDIDPCIALERRILAIAERVLGDKHE